MTAHFNQERLSSSVEAPGLPSGLEVGEGSPGSEGCADSLGPGSLSDNVSESHAISSSEASTTLSESMSTFLVPDKC